MNSVYRNLNVCLERLLTWFNDSLVLIMSLTNDVLCIKKSF